MATELQYSIFKDLYDEEAARYTSLASRAQLYFSIISLYLGAIAFNFADVMQFMTAFSVPRWMLLASGGVLILALLATLCAIWIRDYEGVCDPQMIIGNFGDRPPEDSAFLDDRIADLAVATSRNSKHNNQTGSILHLAISLLFLSVLMHAAIFAVAAFQ